MILKIHPDNPSERNIKTAVDTLKKGGIIIYPTDTIYAIGCDIRQPKAIQKLAKIKNVKLEKSNFSLICKDLSQVAEYTKPVNSNIFKALKRVLPGPYTFIMNANNHVPKLFMSKRKTVGIRIPENNIAIALVDALDAPLVTMSVKNEDEILEYITDPELIYEKYNNQVNLTINGGFGQNTPSTIIDTTNDEIEIIREGLGEVDIID